MEKTCRGIWEGGIKKDKVYSRREVKGTSDYSMNVYRFTRGRRHRKVDQRLCSRSNMYAESVGQMWYLDGVTEGISSVTSK